MTISLIVQLQKRKRKIGNSFYCWKINKVSNKKIYLSISRNIYLEYVLI